MLRIRCPWCGPRDEPEYLCGGPTHVKRPLRSASDSEWAEYLFYRDNPKGMALERWVHAYGCGRWFNVARHTLTHEIVRVYRTDEPPV